MGNLPAVFLKISTLHYYDILDICLPAFYDDLPILRQYKAVNVKRTLNEIMHVFESLKDDIVVNITSRYIVRLLLICI